MAIEVLRAILKDDMSGLQELMNQGFDILDVTEKEGWSYLHRSLTSIRHKPKPAMLQHLIDLGMDINAADIYGNTPLHYAVRSKSPELVRVLIDGNADVNKLNKDGVSPLRQSVLKQSLNHESVRMLLEAGADMEQRNEGGLSIREFVQTTSGDDQILMQLFGLAG